jgi:glutathione S-transferase
VPQNAAGIPAVREIDHVPARASISDTIAPYASAHAPCSSGVHAGPATSPSVASNDAPAPGPATFAAMSGSATPQLTLFAESSWLSPWVFHAMVALEEKQLPYKLQVVSLPMSDDARADLQRRALIAKVPVLVHGDTWISESLAISEYLAETFPAPAHPRLFPADLAERARARQVMSFLRTSLFALREDRPTSTVFGRPDPRLLSDRARDEAAELERLALACSPTIARRCSAPGASPTSTSRSR